MLSELPLEDVEVGESGLKVAFEFPALFDDRPSIVMGMILVREESEEDEVVDSLRSLMRSEIIRCRGVYVYPSPRLLRNELPLPEDRFVRSSR